MSKPEQKGGRMYSIKAKAKEAEIYLYEEIGGWWGGVTAKQFAKDLKAVGEVEKITVRINSPGGDVFDGFAIYNLLKQHQATVVVYVDGLAASIASVVAMAGDEIHIAQNALMMIHEAWTCACGFAADLRDTAGRLDKVNGSIIGTYVKKTGKEEDAIAEMMAAETWMTAEEALEMGFADSIVDALALAAHFDLDKFRFKHNPLAARTPLRTEPESEPGALPRPAAPVAQTPMRAEPGAEPDAPPRPNLEVFETAMEELSAVKKRVDEMIAKRR